MPFEVAQFLQEALLKLNTLHFCSIVKLENLVRQAFDLPHWIYWGNLNGFDQFRQIGLLLCGYCDNLLFRSMKGAFNKFYTLNAEYYFFLNPGCFSKQITVNKLPSFFNKKNKKFNF